MKSLTSILIFSVFIFSCSKKETTLDSINPEVEHLIQTVEYHQLNGVDKNLLSLDIYHTNQDSNKPVVIYVHGGKWSNPAKDKGYNTGTISKLFQDQGYVFVSINYRLSSFPFDTLDPNRVKFPTHNRDVAEAIHWVFNNINLYGGDPNKIGLIGHSAGAYLVALTGTNEHFLNQIGMSFSNIKGIAVVDTKAYDINERMLNGDLNLYVNVFGTDPIAHTRASPLLHISAMKKHPKFLVIKRGSIQSHEIANNFINSLSANGVNVQSVDADVYNHEEVFLQIGERNEKIVTPSIVNFFADCFQ